jgi:hypothetical protein
MAGGQHQKTDPEFNNFDMTQHWDTWSDFNRIAAWVGGGTILILVAMFVFLVPHG